MKNDHIQTTKTLGAMIPRVNESEKINPSIDGGVASKVIMPTGIGNKEKYRVHITYVPFGGGCLGGINLEGISVSECVKLFEGMGIGEVLNVDVKED